MLAPLFDADVDSLTRLEWFVKKKLKLFSPTLHLFPSSKVA
jgi:hypothetical protein